MAQTVTPDQLAAVVSDILSEYGDECADVLEDSIKTVTKKAQSELKGAGSFGGTGKYRKGWKTKIEKTRISVDAVVYNATPGLTHLLENGHALANGGRSRAFPHIAPVNDEAQTEVIELLERKLK
jgi:hypothetical protein